MALTPQQEHFARGCVELTNQSAAYRQAYNAENMTWPDIARAASRLTHDPEVAARIQQLRDEAAERTAIPTLAKRIEEQREIERADPREIVGIHWGACRHCYGEKFGYQWTDEWEYAQACDVAMRARQNLPALAGGFGYNQNRPPNESCTICWGVGVSRPYVTDSRKLTKAAARLYKGIKIKADGSMEILLHDQQKYTDMLNRIQAAYKDGTGAAGGSVPTAEAVQAAQAASTPEDRQRSYLRLVSG